MGKKKKLIFNGGMCPKCGSTKIEFDVPEFNSDVVIFPFICEDCGIHGHEESRMDFLGSYIQDDDVFVSVGEEIKVSSDEEK